MKVAWANFKSTFKKHLGEDGIYALCAVLAVKMLADMVFSAISWGKFDAIDRNNHTWVETTNRRLEEANVALRDTRAALEDAKAQVSRNQTALELLEQAGLNNQ